MSQYQDSGANKLDSLDSKIPAVGQKPEAQSLPVVLPLAQITALTPPSNTGYSTEALQTAGNASLASVDSKLTSKPASTAAVPTDSSLVVAISPNSNTFQLAPAQLAQLTPASSAGSATSALQTAGNNSLASIDSKIPTVGQNTVALSSPVVLPASQITALTPPSNAGYSTAALQTAGNASLASVDSKLISKPASTSALPADPSLVVAISPNSNTFQLTATQLAQLTPVSSTGSATSALQTTGNNSLVSIDSKLTTTNASLVNIDSKIPTVGQKPEAQSLPVVLPVTQITALTPPSNTGYSTTALQTAGNNSLVSIDSKLTAANSSLANIDSKTPAVGQNTVALSSPVVLPISQIAALTPPSNTGYSTTALQTAGNASLASIDTKLTAPISSNLAQVAGSAVAVGNGVTGIASQRVTIASDNAPISTNQTLATSGFTKITDGTNTATIKPASVLALSTDSAIVVTLREPISGGSSGLDLAPLTPGTVATRHGLVGGVAQALGTSAALSVNQQAPLRLTPNGALLTQIDPSTYLATRTGGTPPAAEFVMTSVAARLRSLSYINDAQTVVYIQIHLSNTALVSGTSAPQSGWTYRVPANSQLVVTVSDLGEYGTLLTTGTTARFAISTTRAVYTAATIQLGLGTYSYELIT